MKTEPKPLVAARALVAFRFYAALGDHQIRWANTAAAMRAGKWSWPFPDRLTNARLSARCEQLSAFAGWYREALLKGSDKRWGMEVLCMLDRFQSLWKRRFYSAWLEAYELEFGPPDE